MVTLASVTLGAMFPKGTFATVPILISYRVLEGIFGRGQSVHPVPPELWHLPEVRAFHESLVETVSRDRAAGRTVETPSDRDPPSLLAGFQRRVNRPRSPSVLFHNAVVEWLEQNEGVPASPARSLAESAQPARVPTNWNRSLDSFPRSLRCVSRRHQHGQREACCFSPQAAEAPRR